MKRAVLSGMTALALGASLTACGGSAGLASGDDYSVMGALEELPRLSGKEVVVETGDVVSAERASGLTRPTSLSDEKMYEDWVRPLGAAADAPVVLPYPDFPGNFGWSEPTKKAYGFSVLDVDAFAHVAALPQQFTVIEGAHLDQDTLPDSLHEVADGVVTDIEGEDLHTDLKHATDANQLGRPVRLAARDTMIAASTSTDRATAWQQQDLDPTLADDTALASIAQRLDDHDVASAFLVRTSFSGSGAGLGARMTPEQVEKLKAQTLPQAFDAVGLGWAATDGASTIVVVYHFADEDTASAAAPGLAKIWREGISLRTAEPLSEIMTLKDSTADGDTVTVTLTRAEGSSSQVVVNMLMQRDLPFFHV